MDPFIKLRDYLKSSVKHGNAEHLLYCLRGRNLPLLGGDDMYADIVYRSISYPSLNHELMDGLAKLASTLINNVKTIIQNEYEKLNDKSDTSQRGNILLDDELYLFNLFLFSSYLSVNNDLFQSLKEIYLYCIKHKLFTIPVTRINGQLREAIIVHQVDDSFEEEWFKDIESVTIGAGDADSEQRGNMYAAWRGLLWIPPSEEQGKTGQIVSMERINRGLTGICKAIYKSNNAKLVLKYTVRVLNDTYPRSDMFWAERFRNRMESYPEILNDILIKQWGILESDKKDNIFSSLTGELKSVWDQFSLDIQNEISEMVDVPDKSKWDVFWSNYIITATLPKGFSPQVWRNSINKIKKFAEENVFDLVINNQYEKAALKESKQNELSRKRYINLTKNSRRVSFDREKAKEKVVKITEEIEGCLNMGDINKAKRYLEDLVEEQKKIGTESEHIAKSLSCVAAKACNRGYFKWAEEVYLEAKAENGKDPYVHTGLAETLKAQNKLPESEKLYREIIDKWPNDVVAHTGLAETLKAQNKLPESEKLYRANIQRWSDNPVVKHGYANLLRKLKKYDEALKLLPEIDAFTTIRNQYDSHLRCMILLEKGDKKDEKMVENIVQQALNTIKLDQQKVMFETIKIANKLKNRDFKGVIDGFGMKTETPVINVFMFHAYAGELKVRDALKIRDKLSSRSNRLPVSIKKVAEEINSTYFTNDNMLRTPTEEEFNNIIHNEFNMLTEKDIFYCSMN